MQDAAIDLVALANLRVGMPVSALSTIVGARWIPLRKEDAGYFWGRKLGIPFNARIDTNGMIGQIGIERQFPPSLKVENLHVGMPLPDAKAAQPRLSLMKMFEEERGIANHAAVLANGTELLVRFQDHRVLWFTITRPGLTYPDPTQWVPAPADKYPPPSTAPGEPFADPHFKLVVLDALVDAGMIDLGSPQELTDHILGRHGDARLEGEGPMRDYLVRFPLTEAHLAAVDTLVFEGSNGIYDYAGLTFGYDGSDANVISLAGIERLKNLRRFYHSAMLLDRDLSRLAGLDRLESISLGDRFSNPRTLLTLPALKELQCYGDSIDDPTVIRGLEEKSVKITIFS